LLDWITWVLMIPANGLIKLSAIFLYRRIFVIIKGSTFDIISMILLVICLLWTVAFELATIFGCGRHFNYPWQPLIFVASCNTNVRLDALMISDLLTDIMTWLLPIPLVWKLNLKLSKKLGVIGILLLAAISLAAAVVRLLVQAQISNGGYAAHTDVDFTLSILLYWSMIESGLALIAACLPTVQAIRHVGGPLRSSFASVRSTLKFSSGPSSRSPASEDLEHSEISFDTKAIQTK